MDTTLKPQSANRKSRIITIFLVMFLILAGAGLLAATRFGDEVLAPAMVFLFALCFSLIAAWSRKNQWAILPAGFFASLGLVLTLEILFPESEAIGLGFIPLLAATFLFFAILSKKNWWAILPAGFFVSIGLVVVLDTLIPHEEYPRIQGMLIWGFYTWVLFLGLATTFGILWLLRRTLPTRWAIYPAVGFLAMAVLFIIEGARFSQYWLATTLLVLGMTLLLAVLTGKRPAAGQQAAMNQPQSFITQFFAVAIQGQTYLNLVYLFLAFPLGVFYFILLAVGFSLGFGLLIVWVGALILAMTFVAWQACAVFERQLAVWLLHEDIPSMRSSAPAGMGIWDRIKASLANPVTWKSLAYLLVKLPLGTFTFVVLVTLITLTLGFLAAPVIYPLCSEGIFYCGVPDIYIDTLWKAIGCSFVGLVLFFPALHILNGLAWISGRFARGMLS